MNNNLTLSVTLTGDGRQLNGTLRNARGEVREFGDVSVRDNARATGAFDRTGRSVGTVNNQLTEMNRVGQAARNALLAIGGAIGVREVIGYSDAWTNAKNQLRQVTRTSAELASVQGKLVDIALETRSSFDASANLYARLARSTTELNLTQEDLLGLTTSINQSFATNGATAEEAAAAITQLSQGLAAGALRGDEFNSVSEQAPGIMRAIAESLSMTIGELREFAAQGGITAEIVVNALQRASDSISQDFAKTTATFGQNLEIARTKLVEWVGTSEGVSTAVDTLGGSIVTVSGHLDELVTVAQVGAGLFAGRYTAAVIAATSATVARTAATVADARTESAAAQALTRRTGAEVQSAKAMLSTARLEVAATQGTNAHTFALGQLSAARVRAATAAGAHNTATTAATAAMGRASVVARGLGGAMALVGGPIGLLVGVGGLLYVFREELGLTGQSLGRTEDELADLRQEMAEMSEQDLSRSLDSLNSALDTATLKTARTRQELASLRDENRGSGVLGFGAGEIGKEVRGIQAVAEAQADLRDIEEQRDTARMERVMRVGEEIGGYKTLDQWNQELEGSTQGVATATEVATTATVKATQASDDAAKAAQQQADALEQLRRQLDPAYAASQKLVKSTSILDAGLKSGALTLGEYTDLWGKAADQFINAGNESGTAVDTINDNTDEMGVLWENTLERMDDAGVDMWRSFLDGSEDAFSSFKRLAINTLAEVIHQYTTRQITASFGINAQGGGMGAGGGMGDGFSLDSLNPGMIKKGWDTVSGYFGAGAASGSAAVSYGGTGWASSATSGGGWYGSTTSSGATTAGGSTLGGIYNAGAGLVGGWAGNVLGEAAFGRTANSNYGQMAGTLIGSIWGPLGSGIGAGLGSLVDTLFGSSEKDFDFDFEQGGNFGVFGDRESALGQFGITDFSDYKRGEQQDALDDMLNAIVEFDNTLARVALPERFEQLKESVEGFEFNEPAGLAGARTRAIVEGSGAIGESRLLGIEDDQALAEAFISSLRLESTIAGLGEAVAADINAEIERVVTEGGKAQHAISSMQQAAGALRLLDDSTDRLNLTFDATASGAIHAASGLQDMLGGVENLAAMQSSYYSNYFSETEKAAHAFSDVYDALRQVTDKVPETKREFRELVEAQNLNTEAGREAYAQLLQLAPAFAQVGGSLEDVFSTIYQDVLGREPDDGGIAHWIEQVESGAVSLSEALEQISGSAEAAQSSSEAAAVSIADMSQAVSARQSLERELLRAQGDTEALRQIELGSLRELEGAEQQGLVALQERIWALADAAEADKKAAKAARKKAQVERAIAQERRGLESQLLQVQGDTEALRQLELASLDESNRALQERIWTIQDEMAASEKAAQAEREAISQSMDIIGRIQSARENQLNAELGAIRTLSQLYDSLQLSSESILDPLERMNEAQRQFAKLQVRAENGDTAAVGELQGASSAYLDAVADYYGQSSEQYARVFNDVNTSVEDLGDEFESSVSELNRVGRKIDAAAAGVDANHSESLSALQGIIDGLDWLPAGIGAEIDRVMGNSTASGGAGGSSSGGSTGSSGSDGAPPIGGNLGQNTDPYDPVSAKERAIIKFLDVSSKGSIEGSGILDGMWNLTLGGVTAPFSEGGLLDSYRAAYALEGDSSLPKFANGGQHGGGWRMVGERGPEIEWTPPSRIYSNADSRKILGVGVSGAVDLEPLTRELHALRKEVAQLRAERNQDASHAAGQRNEQLREQRSGNRNSRLRRATV